MSPTGPDALPWMKWFEADFRLSTGGWPRDARTMYRTLLIENWYHGQLPKELNALALLCEYPTAEFEPMWRTYICKKFKRKGKGWINPRIERDRVEAVAAKLAESARNRRNANSRYGNAPEHIGARVISLAEQLKFPHGPKK